MKKQQSVIFAGDYAYIRQIETAIKSICRHNSHLKIYVLNQDIPQEWFMNIRTYIQQMGGDLIDCKVIGAKYRMDWTNQLLHINYMTFARYFIPDFVEEDKVLYLDSDLVVTGDLSQLFEIDLEENYLAAAGSCFGAGVGFNAGVLLINNKKWKSNNIRQKLVDLTEREHENVGEGDQSILNILFRDSYCQLEDTYNFQIGFDAGAAEMNHRFVFDFPLTPLPKILHYISPDKPWNQFSVGRLRDQWWHYSMMEWSYIVSTWREKNLVCTADIYKPKLRCMNLTNSWCVAKIDYLVQHLPEVHFYIVAHTFMADELKRLSAFQNVTLYPNSFPILVENVLEQADLYLDLNMDQKLTYIYDLVQKHQKPMLSFDSSRYPDLPDNCYAGIYSESKPEELVEAIKCYMKEREL